MIRNILRVIIPLLFIGLGVMGIRYFINSKPAVETEEKTRLIPVVRTLKAEKQNMRLTVSSQGTVGPRSVTNMLPEISGRVLYISPSLVLGGFFEENEVLLRIDPYDYQLAITQAESAIAQARLSLEQEKAEAIVSRQEWADLGKGEAASPLVLHQPQIAYAEAALESAKASLEQARRNLKKTEIKAPFTGRVRQKSVDIGQYVSPGASLAQLYSVDVAEVRIPLPDSDLAYVNIPLNYRGEDPGSKQGPDVVVTAEFAGKNYRWKGRIVRTEGEIDPASRMLYAIVQVEDPYARSRDRSKPPLAVGMFVNTEIQGKRVSDVVALPRSAVRDDDTVWIVNSESRLEFRQVNILKSETNRILIDSGLLDGEVICVSPLDAVIEGMQVTVAEGAEILDEEVAS
jgi:RND family efflux transporter MFP subunit